MNMPGFTAGASVYDTRRYSAAEHYATPGTRAVRPVSSIGGLSCKRPLPVPLPPPSFCWTVFKFGVPFLVCCDAYGCHEVKNPVIM